MLHRMFRVWILACLSLCLCTDATTTALTADAVTSDGPAASPSTIIDILSADVQFSSFLLILQRHGLIPYVNTLQNVTLLAPVNLAFVQSHERFTQNTLLRYIIDQKFRVGYMADQPAVFDTLYEANNKTYSVQVSPDFTNQQYQVDGAAIVEADIYAKHQWSFIQALDSQLPLKHCICDILLDDTSPTLNGYDISYFKALFKLLLELQPKKISKKDRKRYRIIPETCQEFIQDVGTVFIPTNDVVFESMGNMTSRYYSTLYHVLNGNRFSSSDHSVLEIKYDITKLLKQLMIPDKVMSANTTSAHYKDMEGVKKFRISPGNGTIEVNKLESSERGSNIVLSDAIVHIFDKSSDFFTDLNAAVVDLTPRKSLFALHYSDFVEELEFRSLDYLIDGSTINQTVLLSIDQRDDVDDEAIVAGFSTKRKFLYQFLNESINIEEKIEHSDETFYKLADTLLCSNKRVNGCFKMKISGSKKDDVFKARINDEIKVEAGPFDIGNNSYAYIVDSSVDPPPSFKSSLSDLVSSGSLQRHLEHIKINQAECLKTVQYLQKFDLLDFKENSKGYTAILPCGLPVMGPDSANGGSAWKKLGLVLDYLEKHPSKFKAILKNIFIEDMIFSDFGLDGKPDAVNTTTLDGELVTIKNQQFNGNFDHIISINNTLVEIPLNSDMLFNQGVVHVVNQLLMPLTFHIPFDELISSTEDDLSIVSFLDLIDQFPKLRELLKFDSEEELDFSLLVPTPESLSVYNITTGLLNLYAFIEAHLIPNSEVSKIFNCLSGENMGDALIHSNNTRLSFFCKVSRLGKAVLDIYDKDGEKTDHKIKILKHGCTTLSAHDTNQPCVFVVDLPIDLKWLERNDGFLHVHLGFISVGVGVILGLIVFSLVLVLVLYGLSGRNEARKNPFAHDDTPSFMGLHIEEDVEAPYDGGYETDDDMFHERDSLLANGKRRHPPSNYKSTSSILATQPVSIKSSAKALDRQRNLPEL